MFCSNICCSVVIIAASSGTKLESAKSLRFDPLYRVLRAGKMAFRSAAASETDIFRGRWRNLNWRCGTPYHLVVALFKLIVAATFLAAQHTILQLPHYCLAATRLRFVRSTMSGAIVPGISDFAEMDSFTIFPSILIKCAMGI